MKPSDLVHRAALEMLRAVHPSDPWGHKNIEKLWRSEYDLRKKERAKGSSYSFGLARRGDPKVAP